MSLFKAVMACRRRIRKTPGAGLPSRLGFSRFSFCRASAVPMGLQLVIALATCSTIASAQVTSTWEERERARIAGILIYTDITAEIFDMPLKQALEQVSEVTGVVIVGRYDDPRHGLGLDPDFSITIKAEQVPAHIFIERILAMVEDDEPVTWQIRGGYVEVGTKSRLASPAAREVRTYYIGDLLRVEDGDALGLFHSRIREIQLEHATELFETIIATVEPEAWEPEPVRAVPGRPGGGPEVRPRSPLRNYGRAWKPRASDLQIRGKWASMRFMNWDRFIINAPDFIHRQINGYPKVIRPRAEEPEANSDSPTEDAASGGTAAHEASPAAGPNDH